MKAVTSVPTRQCAVTRTSSACCCSTKNKAPTPNKRIIPCSHNTQHHDLRHDDRHNNAAQLGVLAAVTAAATGLQQLPAAAQEVAAAATVGAATAGSAAAAAAAASEQVGAVTSTYVPGPVEVTWQIYVGAAAGVIPFLIGAYEFGKRIIIQRRCPRCMGNGLVEREGRLRKCPDCGGFFPWQSWGQFLSATATPGNGGPLLQPKGQTSVLYKVPAAPTAKELEAVQQEEAAIRAAGREEPAPQEQQQQQGEAAGEQAETARAVGGGSGSSGGGSA